MRRDAQVFAMRRSGQKPAHVTLCEVREETPWWHAPEWRQHPVVHLEPGDQPEVADLRFLVGLPVMVDITNPARCMRWAAACKAAGASPVIALHPTAEVV